MNLADLIWQWPCYSPPAFTDASENGRRSWLAAANRLREHIGQAVVIVADNVSEYYFAESERGAWSYDDFPSIALPFPRFFMEMRRPSAILMPDGTKGTARHLPTQWGWYCMADRHPDMPISDEEESIPYFDGWWLRMILVTAYPGKIVLPVARISIGVNGDGSFGCQPTIEFYGDDKGLMEFGEDLCEVAYGLNGPVMLALGFMNCKNVEVVEREPQPRSANSHAKRPPVRYRTITINPLQKSKRGGSAGSATAMKKGLHVCRGHFASYTEKGLFGKHFGQFWIPNHVRGSAEHGCVETTYKVEAPQ